MTRETIVDKIRKLLRLARDKGASENEAATALAMAQKLMLQHEIDNIDEVQERAAEWGKWMGVDWSNKWELVLIQSIGNLYNCRVVVSKEKGDVQFVGKPDNILVCEETAHWVHEQVEAMHKLALKEFKAKLLAQHGVTKLQKYHYRDFRATFKEACTLRVYHRVAEIVAKARNEIPAHMALVIIDQSLAAADDLMVAAGCKKETKAMKLRKSGFGTGAGYMAGEHVKLQQTVEE